MVEEEKEEEKEEEGSDVMDVNAILSENNPFTLSEWIKVFARQRARSPREGALESGRDH